MRNLTELNRRRLDAQGQRLAVPDTQTAATGGSAPPLAVGGLPINGVSPDESLTWHASVTDTGSQVDLRHTCGSQARILVDSAGAATVRVIGCDGVGYKLSKDGLTQVTVTDPGTEDEVETPTGSPMGQITVQACVDGVTKTLHLVGYVEP
jgi:hypothetical protein